MADDFQNDPAQQPGFPSDLDTASSYSGNRPASGARRATPGEVLSSGFQGAQNAGDFLGLDTEFAGSQDPSQFGASPLDLVPPPTTHDDAAGYAPVPEPAPQPASDPVQEFAEAPSAFEFGEDLGSEEGEFAPLDEEAKASKRPLLVAALVIGALGAAGLLYGPSLYGRFFGAGTEVAKAPDAPAQPKPAGKTTPPSGAQPVEPAPANPAASTDTGSTAQTPELAFKAPDSTPASTPSFHPTFPADPSSTPDEDASLTSSSQTSDAQDVTTAALTLPKGAAPSAFPNLSGDEYVWASSDQLELIWRGTEVPLEAVKAPAKTVMPRVGNVRVFTTTGDVFDGHLYAVGQNRVWIDAEPGRVGFDGDKVERIEVLPAQPQGTKSSGDPSLTGGGKRVRVRVPGGMLYGKVLKSTGEDVTLILDDGGRVHVKASELEDLGPGRAVVIRR